MVEDIGVGGSPNSAHACCFLMLSMYLAALQNVLDLTQFKRSLHLQSFFKSQFSHLDYLQS